MREKERLKMGGKEEKRGGCRGESLIISLPIPTTSHFRSTKKPLIKELGERRAERCGEHTPKIKKPHNEVWE